MIARSIIDWCDDKLNEAFHEEDERKGMQKAFVSGAVEGLIDAAIMMYVPLTVACFIYQAKLKKK